MDRERSGPEDVLRRAVYDYWVGRGGQRETSSGTEAQRIPVNVYETSDDVVLVAPMPGVEADDIDVEVLGTTVRLAASLRGPKQLNRDYLIHEWTYGPYVRTVNLPTEVDASRANASHDNGVLVLTFPKATGTKAVRVPLGASRGADSFQRGHSGHHLPAERPEHEPSA